jgi:hypothetical protein
MALVCGYPARDWTEDGISVRRQVWEKEVRENRICPDILR